MRSSKSTIQVVLAVLRAPPSATLFLFTLREVGGEASGPMRAMRTGGQETLLAPIKSWHYFFQVM